MNKKVLVIFCFLFVPCTAIGDVNPIRLKALLQICDAARLSSDLGTINSIASQVRNFERPPDRLLATKYDECLFVAFGKNETAPDINSLIGQIEEIALQLEQDCRELLEIAPSIAVTYPICKNILLIP